MSIRIDRRTLLRGGGAVLALPFLEALAPRRARAETTGSLRFLVLMLPNPLAATFGTEEKLALDAASLGTRLAAFEPYRSRMLHVTGLENEIAGGVVANGRHAVAIPAWGAAVAPVRGDGDTLWSGLSVDQAVVQAWPEAPIASLVLGTDPIDPQTCFPGWACAYRHHLSWSGPGTPLPRIVDPGALFDTIFATGGEAAQEARAWRRSVLDLVGADANRLASRLGAVDRARLDEYLTSVRHLEKQVARVGPPPPAGLVRPEPAASFEARFRLLATLAVEALRLGETRVVSMLYGYSGHTLVYDWLGAVKDHHSLAHSANEGDNLAVLTRIEAFQYAQVRFLLDALAAAQADGGSLLDRTLVVVGHEFGDALSHSHQGHHVLAFVPPGVALARGVRVSGAGRPLGDYHLTLLNALGVETRRFGTTGRAPLAGMRA